MSGPELLVQLSKLFSILSRHTGWMDPVTRATNKPFALLMIGSAQNANLIPAFLVIHNGDGKRRQQVYSIDRGFTPWLQLGLLHNRKDRVFHGLTIKCPLAEHLPKTCPGH